MKVGDNLLAAIGIMGIVVMQTVAILSGINGQIFALSLAGVAGLAGYSLGYIFGSDRPEDDRP